MNEVTKELVLNLSLEMFRDAVKVHYQHGVQEGTGLNFHNIARDSVQAAHSFFRVANQELYTPESGAATHREKYWWAFGCGFELGVSGKALNEPEAHETYKDAPELFDAFVNGWHSGDEKRAKTLARAN